MKEPERFPDPPATPPGYLDEPEYACMICGPLYTDEVEGNKCKICNRRVEEGK